MPRGQGGTGEAVHRGVSLGDSDAIRVRVRAWEPGRIGVAKPRVPAGRGDSDPGRAPAASRVGRRSQPAAGCAAEGTVTSRC